MGPRNHIWAENGGRVGHLLIIKKIDPTEEKKTDPRQPNVMYKAGPMEGPTYTVLCLGGSFS